MSNRWPFASITPIAILVAACATPDTRTPPSVPSALQAPAGTALYLETHATGVQIYECSRKPDATYEWSFKAPEATLADGAGRRLGKHYAGPTWEANDGSTVVGEVKARDAGPTATAIPWLLLAAKHNSGAGAFSGVKYVQRVATVGGVAPATGCTASTLGQQARVPYSAAYLFYR